MTIAALHIVAIGALGVLVRRQAVGASAAWRLFAATSGALAAALLLGPTQERVYAATSGFGGREDMLAAAGPSGEFAAAVLLAMAVVLALPRVRGRMVGNGAAPLECCAANDLNHRS